MFNHTQTTPNYLEHGTTDTFQHMMMVMSIFFFETPKIIKIDKIVPLHPATLDYFYGSGCLEI